MATRAAFALATGASSFVHRNTRRRRGDSKPLRHHNAVLKKSRSHFHPVSCSAASSSSNKDDETYRRVFSEDEPWDSLEEPLTEEDLQNVRNKLPKPIADFVIRRVSADVSRPRDTVLLKYKRSLEDGVEIDIDEKIEAEYEDYLYENELNEKRNLFLSRESEADLEAKRVGYGALAVILLLIIGKFLSALVSFFISFTFSFLAIFALSAGIFIVFVLVRF